MQTLGSGKDPGLPNSVDFFELINRIDAVHIEGFIAREENGQFRYLNDVRDPLTYLIAHQTRKKVFFTFDGINLYQLVEFFAGAPKPIKFVLKRVDPAANVRHGQAFMIMPFRDSFLNEFYNINIAAFLKNELGITVLRADSFLDNDIIIETIYKLIEASEFIIADTTFENKNAFYELGYAACLKKEIITIQHEPSGRELFFDRRHIRSILYDEKKIDSFHFQLKSTIQSIRSRI